jgi:hypothetical protein
MSTILGACGWCVVAPLVLIGLGTALRLGWAAHHRPALRYPVGRDACHPLPSVQARVLSPAEYEAHYRLVRNIWQPNPMTETLIVARPLGWDAQPRTKEYDL